MATRTTNGTQAPAADPAFEWQRWPEAEAFVLDAVGQAVAGNAFAAQLAGRMSAETGTRFADWVDHLELAETPGLARELASLGFVRRGEAFEHSNGMFPRLRMVSGAGPVVRSVAIKVDSVADFSRAHDLGWKPVGNPMGPYRIGRLPGESVGFAAVERRGYTGFEPFPGDFAREGRMTPQSARDALAVLDLWRGRRRRFDDDAEGMAATGSLAADCVERVGPDLASHLVFQAEREFWESRNQAAQVQKRRQDRLGLGWANHDHHTFRSSRQSFPALIALFERLGFDLREHYHAGERAGWGAQILENPRAGIVIFADLDLAPEEVSHDFSHVPLPNLDRPNTVGLWVGLHGESILEAGMHHLEAQFDFEALQTGLEAEAGIVTMKPFSDFPFLRQAFTVGERWLVDPRRADSLRDRGAITPEQHSKFLAEGAVGSHLENLQRAEGFKGFNQHAVSLIIAATDPRNH